MLKIGITGGIGSGKTTVCRIFETLGIPVFYADTAAKQIMMSDHILIEDVKSTFGEESYFNGILNNKYIASIVFKDINQLEKLNALVHPAVFRAFDQWLEKLPQNVPYILKEAALLFESGSYKMTDKCILVVSPLENKLKRVMKRDHVTSDQILARMDKQFTDRQKLNMTDYTIHNNETASLIEQVMRLHHLFLDEEA